MHIPCHMHILGMACSAEACALCARAMLCASTPVQLLQLLHCLADSFRTPQAKGGMVMAPPKEIATDTSICTVLRTSPKRRCFYTGTCM